MVLSLIDCDENNYISLSNSLAICIQTTSKSGLAQFAFSANLFDVYYFCHVYRQASINLLVIFNSNDILTFVTKCKPKVNDPTILSTSYCPLSFLITISYYYQPGIQRS